MCSIVALLYFLYISVFMTAPLLLRPLAPLVHIEDVSDNDAAVLKIINATERELTKLGISPL